LWSEACRQIRFQAIAMKRNELEYTAAATLASFEIMWLETREVVNGVKTTKNRRKPFKNMNGVSIRLIQLNILWWFTHIIRMVMKLVTRARKVGHSSSRPGRRGVAPPAVGSFRFRTSNVIANAKTPSLNASRRPVSFSSNRPALSSNGRHPLI